MSKLRDLWFNQTGDAQLGEHAEWFHPIVRSFLPAPPHLLDLSRTLHRDIYNVIHYNRPLRTGVGVRCFRSFSDHGTEDVFNRRRTKAARKMCPEQLWRVAQRKLDQLNAVVSLASLRIPPGNHLKALGQRDRGGWR